ncbi:helix-turn-helix domain-containing protein [Rhodococcus sp. X156]|uniref:PucR family transcriptional regulator n=1 Tax=Rhodococcus sp. X156 TaxID=2499145 RepID=UPI001F49446C|nr:helix-turn-helix domain-containing protein [Rhodococcus sp. X156]
MTSTRPDGGVSASVLAEVAAAGAEDAGGLPVELLGDFLPVVTAAVVSGRPLTRRQLTGYQPFGETAARQGVALRALLDLYSSAAWRLWRHLPAVVGARRDPEAVVVAGEVMLRAVDDVVAALAEGFQLAQRTLVRSEESARREFIDDLLTGGAGVASVLQRAAGFGLHLSGPHAVAVVAAERPFSDGTPLIGMLERAVLGSKGDSDALVASKEGHLIVVFPAPDPDAVSHVMHQLTSRLGPRPDAAEARARTWQIGVGRPGVGAEGVVASYQEARDALDLAGRLDLQDPVVDAKDMLVYHVMLRDRPAISDLVRSVLTPLLEARGGAEPLLATLAAYFGSGGNAALTARRLHLSVRAVTYRLERVQQLTGHDPTEPSQQFPLQVAIMGAKLLDWPHVPLP